jgi:phenylalanyl-tRNA synthetase alpha chain
MQEFFAKTGNHKLRFKPAYNPYTEVCCTSSPSWSGRDANAVQPSMEVFAWHEGLNKWIEIANVSCSLCGAIGEMQTR